MSPLLLAMPLLLLHAAPRTPVPTPVPTPVVVELFTSEGCSSCPSADQALARLAKAQPVEGVELIPLGFHVDYWDYIGWKDPFASPESGERQRQYALAGDENRVYTPQMVVDGERSFVGAEDEARSQAAASAKRPKVPVRLSVQVEADRVLLQVRTDAAPAPGVESWVALTEDGLSSEVKRGENRGRTLAHAAVVRTRVTLPPPHAGDGGYVTRASLRLDPAWRRENLRAVAVVQAPGGPVRGAATVALTPPGPPAR